MAEKFAYEAMVKHAKDEIEVDGRTYSFIKNKKA